jgi:hypothetical protein
MAKPTPRVDLDSARGQHERAALATKRSRLLLFSFPVIAEDWRGRRALLSSASCLPL